MCNTTNLCVDILNYLILITYPIVILFSLIFMLYIHGTSKLLKTVGQSEERWPVHTVIWLINVFPRK